MPPIPKFPGLAKLINEAAPALVREGTESIAAKTATAEEKEFLDMLRQQMAEREAFKSEFNLPTAHGTSGEKIAQHMDILDKMELEKKLGSDFLLRSEIASKVPDLTIKEFAPHEALHGTGIYSHPYDPKELSYLGPNYKANEYAVGRGEQIIPLRVRGNKTFNFDNNIHHSVSDKVLTRDQSFQKLSELTGTPVDELKQLSAYDIEKLARRYPDQFENITFQGQIKTFKPESLRGQFAEYDPLKRKSGDYMSGLAGAGLIGASALSSNDAEAAPSFKGLKGLIKGVAPSLEKEAEEAAAKEAFKGQFEPGWYHGTNLEKTGGKQIEEFHPNSFFTKDPDFANLHTGTYSGKQGSHIIPASLNVKNFFNPEDPLQLKTLEKFLIKQYKKNPEMQLFEKMTYPNENYFIDPSKRAKHIIDTLKRKIDAKESTWAILEDKNVEQALKNAGYEGSLLTEMGRQTAVSYAPKNVRLPWAKFDPAKKDSGDILAGIAGATGLGAAAMSSSEAKAEPISASKESTPNVQIFRKKSDDQIMKEQLQKTKAELMQTYLDMNAAYANTPVDQRFAYPGAAENLKGYGAGGAEVSDISPIDFITPGMITAPAKALGKGVAALGREAIESAPRILGNEVGELTLPQMRNVAKLMGKNPTERELIEAAELPKGGDILKDDKRRSAEMDLLDFIGKERYGIPHDTPGEQVIEKMQKAHEIELPEGTSPKIIVNPDITKTGSGLGSMAQVKHEGPEFASIPSLVEISNPSENPAGIFQHEVVGHVIDSLLNPFKNYQPELLGNKLDALLIALGDKPRTSEHFLAQSRFYKLRDKLIESLNIGRDEAEQILKNMGMYDSVPEQEAQAKGSALMDFIMNANKDVTGYQDISKAGHHWRYPRNFEMQRSIDLLDPSKPVAGPSLAENARIIKEVAEKDPKIVYTAYPIYKEKGFPNIAELLKERNRFETTPIDPETGKFIFKRFVK